MTSSFLTNARVFGRVLAALALTLPLASQSVDDTSFSIDRGFYDQPFDVVVSSLTPGANVRYTLDGSDPTSSGNYAEGPSPLTVRIDPASSNLRRLTPAVTLRAFAFKSGMASSNVDTHTYVFVDRVLQQTRPSGLPTNFQYDMDQNVVNDGRYRSRIRADLLSLPAMSVVTESNAMFGSNGLLTASASSIEVPGSIEVFYPDGRRGAQADCGFKPHSHVLRKRSLRAYFRNSQYGVGKFKHDLFGESHGADSRAQSFDTLVLRAGVNDNLQSNYDGRSGRATYVTDQLGRASQLQMSGFGMRGTFVHLYINGLYWGLYNPSERADDAFLASYFGGVESDWHARNHGGDLSGDPSHFHGLVGNASNWNVTRDRLDVEAFADYILYYCYSGGGDWPGNNWYAGNRVHPQPGRVRYFVWDCEDTFIRMPGRANDTAWIHPDLLYPNSDIARIWTGADNHADFLMAFADRVYMHCFEDGALTDAAMQARFDRLRASIDGAIVGESARWGRFKGGGGLWTRDNDWIPYCNSVRGLMGGNVQRLLSALRNVNVPSPHPKYYPDTEAPLFTSGPTALTLSTLTVPPSFPLRVARVGSSGTVYLTLDGTDPRAAGGAARGVNVGASFDITVTSPTVVSARTLRNGEWSPLHRIALDVLADLPVEIHEFLASNQTGIRDEAGQRDDWIEILNRASVPIDLSGYHLTDDLTTPTKWRLPGGTIVPPGQTVLVWADGDVNQGSMHANFALSANGERLALYDPSGTILIDGIQFGPQTDDVSTGRLAGSMQTWVALSTPTPRQPNRPSPSGHLTYGRMGSPRAPITVRGEGAMTPGETWTVALRGALPWTPMVFLVGEQPLHRALGTWGTLLVDPWAVVPAATDAEGKVDLRVPLPSYRTVRQMTLCVQAVVPLGANLVFTDAVLSRVCQ